MSISVPRQAFDQLARSTKGPCVSILVPLDRHHPDEHLAHTTLKDLTNRARDQLAGHDGTAIDQLLAAPCAALNGPLARNGRSAAGFYSAPGFSIDQPHGNNVDLINRAVIDAWRTGASLRTTTADRLPTGAPLAATFRY
jgi:hypothetical protein